MLRAAAKKGNTAEVCVRLAAGTDPDAADKKGNTALHLAAYEGHEEVIVALAEGGADLDSKNQQRATPLLRAAGNGQSGVVKLLLGWSRQGCLGPGGSYVSWFGAALQAAEAEGHHDVVALLKRHAKVEERAKTREEQLTPSPRRRGGKKKSMPRT